MKGFNNNYKIEASLFLRIFFALFLSAFLLVFFADCAQAQVISSRISSGLDDAEEHKDGSVDTTSTDLELVYDDYYDSNQIVGMRFKNISIPKDAIIKSASIQFQVDENRNSSSADLTIRGEGTGNSNTFQEQTNNISGRSTTTAKTNWSPSIWGMVGSRGSEQKTPDISAIIQEIVSRSDWQENNNLTIIITGTGNRIAESYNGSQSGAPMIEIEFEVR